jgi:hypothetical protein
MFKYSFFYRYIPTFYFLICHINACYRFFQPYYIIFHTNYICSAQTYNTVSNIIYLKNFYQHPHTLKILSQNKFLFCHNIRQIKFLLAIWNKNIYKIKHLIKIRDFTIPLELDITSRILLYIKNGLVDDHIFLMQIIHFLKLRYPNRNLNLNRLTSYSLKYGKNPNIATSFIQSGSRPWLPSDNFFEDSNIRNWFEINPTSSNDEYLKAITTCLEEKHILYLMEQGVDTNYLRRFLLNDSKTTGNDVLIKLENWCTSIKPLLIYHLPIVLVDIIIDYIQK